MTLDRALAERAIEQAVSSKTGASPQEAAWTIHDVVNESMAAAVRMHVSERGGDPSRPVLIAFGGAGPVHVVNLAGKLGIRRILIPLRAGVLSALGLVLAPAAFDIARTRKAPLAALDLSVLMEDVGILTSTIRDRLAEVDPAPPRFEINLGLGYIGQSYHVPVAVDVNAVGRLTRGELLQGFAKVYRERYGYYYDDVPVELVSVHVTGTAGSDVVNLPEAPISGSDATATVRGEREAWSARRRAFMPFTVYRRERLLSGMRFDGPCLIEEDTATTVVDAGATIAVDRYGSLDILIDAAE